MKAVLSTGRRFEQSPVAFLARNGIKEARTNARTYLGSMRFTQAENGTLSGGQQAKILFLDMI